MATVTYNGETFSCVTALKGADYVHLLDSEGIMVAAFDGVEDFSLFTISDGDWTDPTPAHDCSIAVVGDDGVIRKGGHPCSMLSGLGNEYVWAKYRPQYQLKIDNTIITSSTIGTQSFSIGDQSIWDFSDNVEVGANGNITLTNPTNGLDISGGQESATITETFAAAIIGKYLTKEGTGEVWYVVNAECATQTGFNIKYKTVYTEANLIFVGYVNSSDPDAYPEQMTDAYTTLENAGQGNSWNYGDRVVAEDFEVTENGTFRLLNPITITTSVSDTSAILNKYTCSRALTTETEATVIQKVVSINQYYQGYFTANYTEYSEPHKEKSPYTDEDGNTYEPLGQLGTLFPGTKIETGSYTGTGTYGYGNENSLTFSFIPQLLFIDPLDESQYSPLGDNTGVAANPIFVKALYERKLALGKEYAHFYFPSRQNATTTQIDRQAWAITFENSGKTIKWYLVTGSNVAHQLNSANTRYQYIAIG